ncbi:MAG: hypothetical protein U0M61_06460 [Succinivibrio sp.]|nr:hypothetical protein [Succinivibrio sp.]
MYNKPLSILTKRTSMVTFNLDRAHRMVHIKLSKKYIFGFKTETELHFTYFEYKLFANTFFKMYKEVERTYDPEIDEINARVKTDLT